MKPKFSALTLSILICRTAFGEACFDFEKKNLRPLQAAPTVFVEGKDEAKSQEGEINRAWVSGLVKKSISELHTLLLDPKTIRNGSNTKVEVNSVPSELFLNKIEQTIKVKPVFFLTIEWKEIWAYALEEGTKNAPKKILIAYEKVSGTSYIRHLCGNIVLQRLTPDQTGVYIYEEINADRRNAQTTLDGINGTLRTLREMKKIDEKI